MRYGSLCRRWLRSSNELIFVDVRSSGINPFENAAYIKFVDIKKDVLIRRYKCDRQ